MRARVGVLLLLSLLHFVGAFHLVDPKNFERNKEQCLKELNLSEVDFRDAQRAYVGAGRRVNNTNANCLIRCFFKKWGFFDDADHLQVEAVRDKLRIAADESVNLDRCKKIKPENKCDAALLVNSCIMWEADKPMYVRKYGNMSERCVDELGLSYTKQQAMDFMASLDGRQIDEAPPDDEHFRCFQACMLRKLGFFDDEGELLVDSVLATVREMRPSDTEKCTSIGKTGGVCDRILTVRKCLVDEMDRRRRSYG